MERASKSSGERNVDRLSDLPDGVICHILSFLQTKRSVQTSVLAKRWRTLWAHVPFINLLGEDATKTTFSGIVCTVLLRHKAQSLNTCSLAYIKDDDDDDDDDVDDDDGTMSSYELETCIATVVERNVQNLYLELRVEVPRCVLTCKTLVDLTMVFAYIPSSGPIYLPNLKKLHLWDLNWEVNYTRLLSGCPVLEELIIEGTTCRDPRGCYISSPTLKRLTIIFLLDESKFNNPDYMVTINTPALRYLHVDDCESKHFSISPCAYLVEADITVYSSCVLKFLDIIHNVKCLQLRGSCDKICDGLMSGSIAKFGNLTKLELYSDWRLLSYFLESADHLQVLIIHGCHFQDDSDSEHWKEPIEERCACLFYSLRTVRITNFPCTEEGFNMVRYILRNAQVLERMEMDCQCVGLKEKFDAIQRICLFRRGSKECELAFS